MLDGVDVDAVSQTQTSPISVAELEKRTSTLTSVIRVIAENKIVEFTPQLLNNGDVVYPEVGNIIGVDSSQVASVLEQLSEEKVLSKEATTLSFKCPGCNTTVATASLVCPTCGGTELIGGSTLQHLGCLYLDFESEYDHRPGGEIYCPKCEKRLESLGSDYLMPGTFFKCTVCGEFTARAKRLYSCSNCQQVYETMKEPPIEVYKYRVNKKVSCDTDHSLAPAYLARELENAGFRAEIDATIKGKSGCAHSFSLVVENVDDHPMRVKASKFAVDLAFAETDVDPVPLFSLFAKATDSGLSNCILLGIPSTSDETRMLADSYGIQVLEARDMASAAKLLLEHIKKEEVRPTEHKSKRIRRRRGSIDIMADILSVTTAPSSKSEIIACANLSFEQCQRYLRLLEKMGLLGRYLEDAVRVKYLITEKGREYVSNLSGEYGRIAEGDESIWGTRRRSSTPARRIN